MTSKSKKIPTIIGMVILAIGTFAGVYLLKNTQVFKIGASAESLPKDVRISNITDTSTTISWTTDKDSLGYLIYGEDQKNISEIAKESTADLKTKTHIVTLTGLSSEKSYFFKINSDGTVYDNNSSPWSFTTGAEIQNSNKQTNVSGSVISATGVPTARALVYINISGYLLSTITSDTGNFVIQISQTRESNLQNFKLIDPASTLLEIFVQEDSVNVASAQIFVKSANPIPPIIIGQTHDFRNEPENINGDQPNANPNLPQDVEKQSKFTIPQGTTTPSSNTITLKSLDEGETITSTEPEFSGSGPAGATFTITVESENPMTDDVKVANNGTWKWAVPEGLTEGVHKITISWKENGITRTLTRNFIVQAGELPAFEATPSQTLAATATSTATPKATTTATASAIPTTEPIPETGSLTPTIVLSIMGILAVGMTVFVFVF